MVLYYAHRVVFLLLYFTSQQAASSIQIIKIMVHCSCLLSTVIMVVQTRGPLRRGTSAGGGNVGCKG